MYLQIINLTTVLQRGAATSPICDLRKDILAGVIEVQICVIQI